MKLFFINVGIAIIAIYLVTKGIILKHFPLNGIMTVGLFISVMAVLWLFSFFYSKSLFKKIPKLVGLCLYFFKELTLASLKVAYEIITPQFSLKPAVLAFPLTAETDFEITVLANMISLTPGTFSLAVSEDRKILYVHSLYASDLAKQKAAIKNGFEKRILGITRS